MKIWLFLLLVSPSSSAILNGRGHAEVVKSMYSMLEAQVKHGTEINEDVGKLIDKLLEMVDDIIAAIKEDFNVVKAQIQSNWDAVEAKNDVQLKSKPEANSADIAVSAITPRHDSDGCRKTNMDLLKGWESKMTEYYNCRYEEEDHWDHTQSLRLWNWEVEYWGPTTRDFSKVPDNGHADDNYWQWCKFLEARTGPLPTDPKTYDHSAVSKDNCEGWEELEDGLATLHLTHTRKRGEHTDAADALHAKHFACEELWTAADALLKGYYTARETCYKGDASRISKACGHGGNVMATCQSWCHHDNYQDQVKGKERTADTYGTGVSEKDRQDEFEAVAIIRCLLKKYLKDKAEFDAPEECYDDAKMDFDTMYADEIGTMVYYDIIPPVCELDHIEYIAPPTDWEFPSTAENEIKKCVTWTRTDGSSVADVDCPNPYHGSSFYKDDKEHKWTLTQEVKCDEDYKTLNILHPYAECPQGAPTEPGTDKFPTKTDHHDWSAWACVYEESNQANAPAKWCSKVVDPYCDAVKCLA